MAAIPVNQGQPQVQAAAQTATQTAAQSGSDIAQQILQKLTTIEGMLQPLSNALGTIQAIPQQLQQITSMSGIPQIVETVKGLLSDERMKDKAQKSNGTKEDYVGIDDFDYGDK